jgi:hypothetical protein
LRFLSRQSTGECTNGVAVTFDLARADFEAAWAAFLSKRTEADFQAWRDERDWTARKYALWDAGKRLPPNEWEPGKPYSRFRKCPCGGCSICTRRKKTWCMSRTSAQPNGRGNESADDGLNPGSFVGLHRVLGTTVRSACPIAERPAGANSPRRRQLRQEAAQIRA